MEGFFAQVVMDATRVNGFDSSGPKTAGKICDLGGNFSRHYFSVAVATKTVAAWSAVKTFCS